MNTMAHHHDVALRAAHYHPGGMQLHRYFETEFVNRFYRDLERQRLADTAQQQWKKDDAFSKFGKQPVLRLPMHRSFYVVSCSVVCDRLGEPALDPRHIKSAGFVIRRTTPKGEESWMLEDDEALGWQPTPTGLRDPDLNRRLCCDNKGLKIRGLGPNTRSRTRSYTGEQTHPLHPTKSYDADGKCHTILFGYLPLGGSYVLREEEGKSPFDADSLRDFSRITAAQLPWPFGFKPATGSNAVDQTWRTEHTRPVDDGLPTSGFFELLKILVNRYHLGEPDLVENTALQAWAERQYFYLESANNQLSPVNFTDHTRGNFQGARRQSLGAWLKGFFSGQENTLVNYMAEQEVRLDKGEPLQTLPATHGQSFYMTPADAQELRSLIDQRTHQHALGKAREIPLPKFTQGRDDLYQIVPFVRVLNDCGHEEIVWGDNVRTELFRVAAPFDPNASRAVLIQMPSLADLKGGLAKGVSMVTPADTFSLLNVLNLKKGASEDVVPGKGPHPSLGIQWICSFSLPVITLVAMILLMIMISLLNILFFWLPWVRICLPFPKIKQ